MSGWWKPLSFTEGRAAQGQPIIVPGTQLLGGQAVAQFLANGLLQSLLARAGV